ncbi:terminase large subunit [Gordonia phage Schiebs]|nr:terminase large subunit [Gordonia phage Schiebs]
MAAMLGTPYMPWQRMAADVLLEVDDAGRFVYHTGIITVPRQAGKTASTMSIGLHRTLTTPNGKVWYTAQTGQAARERFLGDMAEPAQRAARALFDVKKGAGDTRLVVPAIGSQFRPHPPSEDYLHGEQSDLNLVDEPWSYSVPQGVALMQAITPTQNTRPNAQTIFLSTMGTAASTWWHDRVEEAREGRPGVAIIDYGIPQDADPTDLELVAACHPAVGHTIGPEAIHKAAGDLPPAEFARAYGNVPTRARTALIPADTLDAAEDMRPIVAGTLVIAAAVSWDRDYTAVVAVGHLEDGTPAAEVIADRPGTSWAAEFIEAVAEAQRPAAVVVDRVGPSATLADELTRAGVELLPLTGRDVSVATDDFLTRLTDPAGPRVRWRPSPALRTEWAGVVTRTVADVGRMFSRRHSAAGIARIEAMNLGVFALAHLPAVAPAPQIWTPAA